MFDVLHFHQFNYYCLWSLYGAVTKGRKASFSVLVYSIHMIMGGLILYC